MNLPPKRAWCQLLITLTLLARAAELPLVANPIHLHCVIRDSYLVHDYGESIIKVQKDLCANLKARLNSKPLLLAWEYVPFEGTTGMVPKPALVLTLTNEGQTRRLTLRLEPKSYPAVTWPGIWKEPGDTFPDPWVDNAAEFFAEKTGDLILSQFEEKIYDNLKPIAIATASWSSSGAPKVVTSLPWRGREALRASRFRLVCQPKSEALESRALMPDDGPFTLEAKYRLSDKKSVGEILPEVKRLTPEWLFLLDFQVPDDTEIYTN